VQERLRVLWKADTFHGANLKFGSASIFQKHHGSYWKRAGDAYEQRPNMLVVPNPTALKVRQLDFPFHDLFKKFS